MAGGKSSPIRMEESTDPEVLAQAEVVRKRADKNWAWFKEHTEEIYAQYRGKCICISGEQVFAGDTSPEAVALAKAAHPDDVGRFILRVPQEKAIRMYYAH